MRLARSVSLILCLFLLVAGFADRAPAQQPQQKRIALVVGDGNYAKAPLATAANDAGLIAQTLQAAGFDVIGARDLDADSLRKSFRDFMEKVRASPSDTVAMLYLSGYAIQLAGENYFIPVDSNVSRDTDIPIEGLRVSDYTRELASVSAKASIVVLDGARQQPFIQGGNPIAGGLALVDPSPNMLIAFNAAPGTVGPSESGNYGVYAQSLAEMIRTGGLSLPEVFDRVRLRVSEVSKGAQVPWDAQKIQTDFSFFDRAPDAPPVQGSADQVAAIRERPMRDLGAQEAFSAALARDSMQGYEDFLAAYPADPLAKRVHAILAARREAITWRRTYLADTPEAYWSYLRRYPRGPHAWDARRRLAILSAALEPPSAFAVVDYDLPAPPPDEFVYVDRPVFYFGDPEFGFVPPPPLPVFFLPPPPPDFVILAPPIAVVGLFLLPRPQFVPMPVFVRPPVYVVAPPNNIVFNNIHNTTIINTVINNPAPSPAALAAAGAPRTGVVGPTLPNTVAQRASLIQQGKLAPPPSASINPTVKPGTPGSTPVNVTPSNATPLRQELPKANALPVPGAKGTPPVPPSQPTATANPSQKLTPPSVPGKPNPNLKEEKLAPTTASKPPPANDATNPAVRGREKSASPTPSATTSAKPETRLPPPSTHVVPPPSTTHVAPPVAHVAPPPPATHVAPPPPAARVAPPPPPAARVAPPPPPPPPPRPAPPPPQMARPAPPPPVARVAPPPAAAAKKCPPNQPRC